MSGTRGPSERQPNLPRPRPRLVWSIRNGRLRPQTIPDGWSRTAAGRVRQSVGAWRPTPHCALVCLTSKGCVRITSTSSSDSCDRDWLSGFGVTVALRRGNVRALVFSRVLVRSVLGVIDVPVRAFEVVFEIPPFDSHSWKL